MKKPNIYDEKIIKVNLRDRLEEEYPDEVLLKAVKAMNFHEINYIFCTESGNYWCGILTAEPFNELNMCEEDMLNTIKDHHMSIKGGIVDFKNPSLSPFYRFFHRHRETGYGWNVPCSVNTCFERVIKELESMEREGDLHD